VENLDPTGIRSPDSPARYHDSQSLRAVFINKVLLALQINAGNDLLNHEVSRSHDASNWVGLLWTSDQPFAQTST